MSSLQSPPPNDDAFPSYRSEAADRDRALRRVRQVTALLGVGAAVGTGAFTLGLAAGSAPTPSATVAAAPTAPTAQAPAQAPATLTGFASDEGDDGGWHPSASGATAGAVTAHAASGSAGSVTTSGGSAPVTIP